jgi:hypothetical protein
MARSCQHGTDNKATVSKIDCFSAYQRTQRRSAKNREETTVFLVKEWDVGMTSSGTTPHSETRFQNGNHVPSSVPGLAWKIPTNGNFCAVSKPVQPERVSNHQRQGLAETTQK